MSNRENLKIILSALLVILIISLGIYGFIFRNEISNKIYEISKKPENEEKVERLVLDHDKPPANLEDFENQETLKNKTEQKPLPGIKPELEPEKTEEHLPPAKEIASNAEESDFKKNIPTAAPSEKQIVSREVKETVSKRKSALKTKSSKKRKSPKKKRSRKKREHKLTSLEKRINRLEKKMGVTTKKSMSMEKRIRRLESKIK